MSEPKFTAEEILEQFEAEVWQKTDWLSKFSKGPKKWPDAEIAKKERELRIYDYLAGLQISRINARKSA